MGYVNSFDDVSFDDTEPEENEKEVYLRQDVMLKLYDAELRDITSHHVHCVPCYDVELCDITSHSVE